MNRLVVGPFNRVEGDLEVRLSIEEGYVQSADVVSPMFRGYETILLDRARRRRARHNAAYMRYLFGVSDPRRILRARKVARCRTATEWTLRIASDSCLRESGGPPFPFLSVFHA